jgi:hypothetical protein
MHIIIREHVYFLAEVTYYNYEYFIMMSDVAASYICVCVVSGAGR